MWPDKNGNMCIGFLDLDGKLITFDSSSVKSKVSFEPIHLKRFSKSKNGKYAMCRKGLGVFAWTSPRLIEKYQNKKKIKRLVITEGPIKGIKAYVDGIDIIAIPGITAWKVKGDHEIFYQIREIVQTCNVQELLWITDNDTLSVNYEEGKDLYRRPSLFYHSVKVFKELCREWDVTLYYGHLLRSLGETKGLDDVLIAHPEDIDQVRKELFHIPAQRKYTVVYDITTWSNHKIQKYFGIGSNADAFHDLYSDDIEEAEFVYRRGLYIWDDSVPGLRYIKTGESASYVRVGAQYYRKGSRPTIRGRGEKILMPIKVDEIRSEHKTKSNVEQTQIIHDIDYYNGFLNRPSHLNYEQHLSYEDDSGFRTTWYNSYKRVNWKTTEGKYDQSLMFIKHIFGIEEISYHGKSIKSWELGLDYIKILWEKPQHLLPILSLVSKDRHTGKTTFWDWMRLIFQQNVKIIRHEALTGQFTSSFANCLLVVIDEAAIEKTATIERIKSMVTAKNIDSEAKFQHSVEGENFIKVGMSSNNINNFARIDNDEIRFWVRDIPAVPEEEQNFSLLEDLEKEIPAFLGYIERRKMTTKDDNLAWFQKDLIFTEALLRVQKESRSSKEIVVEKLLREHMLNVGKAVIKMTSKNLKALFDDQRTALTDIRWVVDTRWDTPTSNGSRFYDLYYLSNVDPYDEDSFQVHTERKKSVHYIFTADNFLKLGELCRYYPAKSLIELETELLKLNKPTFFKKVKVNHVLEIQDYAFLVKGKGEKIRELFSEYGTFLEFHEQVINIEWAKS